MGGSLPPWKAILFRFFSLRASCSERLKAASTVHQEQSAQSDDLVWRLFVLCGSNEGQGAREDKTRAEKESERKG